MEYEPYPGRKRFRPEDTGSQASGAPMNNFRSPAPANPLDSHRPQGAHSGPPRKGRGKGMHDGSGYVPTTEHRIPVDVNAFPPDCNIIMQLLGPRGRHQQRMKMESDAIVTTSGKGVRGQAVHGEEPLTLVVRSKDPAIPLTARQITSVYQIYEDILKHVKESGNSDNAGSFLINTNHIQPASLMEFLWNMHLLLIRPRHQDLRVEELYDAYFDQFGHECQLSGWLVVDSASGGVRGALSRIPHIVELYHTSPESPWFMRAANAPDLNYTQLREVDDAYKIRLQQIAAGRIPLEDLADSSGITGMLFGLDRVAACVNILQGVIKILTEKRSVSSGLDLATLQAEFLELYKIPLDVFNLIQEKSLLGFLLKFKIFFNVFNDGIGWKIVLNEEVPVLGAPPFPPDVESVVKSVILVQPSHRKVVRLAPLIPPPVAVTTVDDGAEETKGNTTDSIAALVSILQGFKQPTPAPVAAPAGGSSVTAQIHQLLQKKKQQAEPAAAPASGTALNELMAALQAAKKT